MSKLYAIYAYDNLYQGYDGICNHAVVEAQDRKEADEYGYSLSGRVIEDYVSDDINIDNEVEYDLDIAYEVYEITTPTNKSLEILTNEFSNNKQDFISKYCI